MAHLRYGSPAREGRMLRTERYKYLTHNSGKRPEQLFDLFEDPGEMHNLVAVAAAKPVLQQHRLLLHKELLRTQDPFRLAV